jgi:stage III sporulation protein AG
MEKLKKWLSEMVQGNSGAVERKKLIEKLLVIGGIGFVLLLISHFVPASNKPNHEAITNVHAPVSSQTDSSEQTTKLEVRLKTMLEQLPGIGIVDVMIVMDTSSQLVIQQDTENNLQQTNEQDQNGATRQIQEQTKHVQTIMQQTSDGQKPFILETIAPKIRGVLIVADGAEHAVLKQMIVDAVRKSIHVRLSAISVLPRKSE